MKITFASVIDRDDGTPLIQVEVSAIVGDRAKSLGVPAEFAARFSGETYVEICAVYDTKTGKEIECYERQIERFMDEAMDNASSQ